MKMRAWICVILAMLMLAGCAAAPMEEPASEPEEAPAEQVMPEAEAVTEFSFGTVEGSDYRNPLLGYGCYLENWSIYDSDYNAQLNGLDGELSEQEKQKIIDDAALLVDISAESEDGLQTLTIQFQNVKRVYGTTMEEEALLEALLPTAEQTLEAAGYEKASVEKTTVNLCGDAHPCLLVQAQAEELPINQLQVVVQCGDYMAFITATGYLDESPEDILRQFYKL